MLFNELNSLNQKLIMDGYSVKLLSPIPPGIKQRGQTCKLVALSSGMHYLYQTAPEEYPSPPYPTKFDIRQNHSPDQYAQFKSLRELAKLQGSKVGEIYNMNHLIQLGKQTGYPDFHFQSYDSPQTYCDALIAAINNGVPSNVYFDVDIQTGLPIDNNSQSEHAALVIGYAQLDDVTKIILLTWDQYVAVDAAQLYQSSTQLDQQRRPEAFAKISGFWKNVSSDLLQQNNSIYRQALAPSNDAISLRGKILFLSHAVRIAKLGNSYINKVHDQLINEAPRNNLELLVSEQEHFFQDTGERLNNATAHEIAIKRQQLGKAKYLPLETVVHYFETASLLPGRLNAEMYASFAREFAFNDEMMQLCVQEYQTKMSGSLIDDIHRQNPDTKRSIIELTSNACDSAALRVTVSVQDGYYDVIDDGFGMSPEIIFNHLLVPKSSSKTIGDFIGRFGIGFYTCLAHLKNEQSEVVVTTKAKDHSAYQIHFRYRAGQIEINIAATNKTTVGTQIRVSAPEIKQAEYLSYVRHAFVSAKAEMLVINDEKSQLSDEYKSYQHQGLEMLVSTATNIRGLRTVISNVLISENVLPKQSHSLDVIWILPRKTNITESRNQIQLDDQSTIDAICQFIDMVDLLPSTQQIAYLNSIGSSLVQLQNSNVHIHLLKTLKRLMGEKKAVIDHNDFRYLQTANTVPIQRVIIPSNWKEKLGFAAPEWSSLNVSVIIVDSMSEGNKTLYDDIEQTLYIAKTLYNKAISNKTDQRQLMQLTNIMLGSQRGHWDFAPRENKKYQFAKDCYSFDQYKVPLHHALYLQHGVLYNVPEEKLNLLTPDTVKTVLDAPTLIARYPFKNSIQKGYNNVYSMDSINWAGHHYYQLHYQGESYFFKHLVAESWNSMAFNRHFEHITGTRGDLLVAIMRNQITRRRNGYGINPDPDKVIMRSADKKTSQLVALPSMKILQSHLPLYSDYYPIEGSDHYYITTHGIDRGQQSFSSNEQENRLYHSSGSVALTIQGDVAITTFNNGFLACSSYSYGLSKPINTIQLLDQNLKVLSTTKPSYFFPRLSNSIKSYTFEDQNLLVIKMSNIWLAIKYDPEEQIITDLPQTYFVGTDPQTIVIDNIIYQLNDGAVVKQDKLIFMNATERSCLSVNDEVVVSTRFVVYQNAHAERILLTSDGKRWPLEKEIEINGDSNVETNAHFCAISDAKNQQAILLSTDSKMEPKRCQSIQLASNIDTDFALIDGKYVIDENHKIILSPSEEIESIEAIKFCPYLIVRFNIEDSYYNILLDKQGNKIRPEQFKSAYFKFAGERWVICATQGDAPTIMLDENGIITSINGGRAYSLTIDHRYQWINELGMQFYQRDTTQPNIGQYAHFAPEYDDSYNRIKLPPQFYKAIDFDLLSDLAVITNLKFLNKMSLTLDEYAHYLRFVDCDSQIFELMYPYMAFFTHTPSREEFRHYFDYHQCVLLQDSSFILNAMRLIDIIYASAANNSNIHLGTKLGDIAKIYGVSYLHQLFAYFTRARLELNYYVNYDAALHNSYLARLPNKLREIAYYLFSSQVEMFAKNHVAPLLNFSLEAPKYSILDLIVLASLHAKSLQSISSPAELTALIRQYNVHVDKTLPLRNLRHAIYHLNGVGNLIYLREFIQNALDASKQMMTINIDLQNDGNNRHVTRVTDTGVGMDLQTILSCLIVPGHSLKRGKKEMIGGRGVGFFSAFIGAELLTLKTSVGDGKTYYLQFKPITNAGGRIEDISVCFNIQNENFKGTIIERVSHAGNVQLEAAKAINAARLYARFVDANKIKIHLNGTQINQQLELIGSCNLEKIGSASIYVNAECAFTAGGLFVRNIDAEYWDCVPEFMRRELQKVGIVIELPGGICLTRERNNFYAVDKFVSFFKPLFFYLCLNAYCSLLKSGRIKNEYLPYDLLEKLTAESNRNQKLLQDAQQINCGGLIQEYKEYLNYENCLTLLSHIKFIPYGEEKFLSIDQIAFFNRQSKLKVDGLPEFIRWRLKKTNCSLQYQWEHHSLFIEAESPLEVEIKKYKYCSWSSIQLERMPDLANWNLFRKIIAMLFASISKQHHLILDMYFSTVSPEASAFVNPGKATIINIEGVLHKSAIIYFNPFAWENKLNALFRSSNYSFNGSLDEFMNQLVDVISHEIAHLLEGSFCGGGARVYTHDKPFRDIQANVYASLMLENNLESLYKETKTQVEIINKVMSQLKRLPTAKDLMIMELLEQPDYLRPAPAQSNDLPGVRSY